MHLRRILAGFPGCEVVGHIRPGACIDDGLQGGQIDGVLIDAGSDAAAARELVRAALRRAIKVLVLTVEACFDAPVASGRIPFLQRPSSLEKETAASPFGAALQRKLQGLLRPATIVPSPMPPVARRGLRWAKPELIAIGSSTGGPQALPEVLRGIAGRVSQATVITQHMPAAFTRMLASHLSRYTKRPTVEVTECMPIHPGSVYLAAGGRHMVVMRKGEQLVCQPNDGPEENFCRPAVDPMLRSVADAVGGKALAVILTGMGQDGLLGCRALVEAGGAVIAQDEATSVVWGMPGAVAHAGLCRSVVPLSRIAEEIIAAAGPES